MRVEDFPRPKDDNRRGVHWSASVYHPAGSALDFWISEMQAMHIKWVKLMDDSGGSSLELCERLLAADIMPIVRLYRLEPNPETIGGREVETLRRLIAAGVRYFETNNEPDIPAEWQSSHMPPDWLNIVIDNFIIDADKILNVGGLPAFPAMGISSTQNRLKVVADKGRADLFEHGAWVALHNYTLNHPLDYPYDPVNQEGMPVSQEEYDRLGPWAWEGRPREMINEWRRADKNPGHTLTNDAACFLSFHLLNEQINQAFGHLVPIISTEGGPVIGWKDDRRYPRVDPFTQADWVVAINNFMQNNGQIHGLNCPENYFTMCYWLLGNYHLGFMAPGWESQSWYSDWWNQDFKLAGRLPVVAAVKAMPNLPVDKYRDGVIAGRLTRTDTGEPLPDLKIALLQKDKEIAATSSAADGAFRFERLTHASYDLAVAPWGVVRHGVLAAAEPIVALNIALTGGASSVLSGKVLDHTGQGRGGIPVALRRADAAVATTVTDAEGAFRFTGLPLGAYRLEIPGIAVAGIMLDGWAAKSLKLTLGTPASYRYAVTQQRLLSEVETANRRIFYGVVTDAAGTPLKDIKVQMAWQDAEPGTTFPTTPTGRDPYKPAGQYEFVHTAGAFALQVAQGDWPSDASDYLDTATVPGRVGEPVAYEVNFQLQPFGAATRVDGVIAGAAPGRVLTLIGAAGSQETAVAADGSFAFDSVTPGIYRLELAGLGPIAEGISLQPGGLFKLFFTMRSRLTGQVIAPPAGMVAVLHAPPAWSWTRQVPVNPDGTFAFEGLPAGRYRLQIGDRILPDLDLNGETTLQLPPIDLGVGQRSALRGRVADGAGKPQPNVLMTLRRFGLVVAQRRSAADGTYLFNNLPAGTYALEAAGKGVVADGIALDGEREQVRDVLWDSAGHRSALQGRVLTVGGKPRPGVTVRLLRADAEVGRTQSDSAGGFRFTELAGGVYDLGIGDSGAVLVANISLAEDTTIAHDLLLPAPQKPLAHYLLFDRAATETELALTLALRYLRRTGASGGFRLADAAQAATVTIVGDQVPVTAEATLSAAGCEVGRLSGDGYALAAQLAQLLAKTGEG